jgi:hypothetical protein
MAKLCAKGKAAAKRKFKVYPSAYANMYASGVCSGKITPGGKKRKKMMDGGRAKGLIPEAQEKAKSMTVKSSKRRVKKMGGGRMMPDRVMLKSGGMCKLASKGKGRAYGKNS